MKSNFEALAALTPDSEKPESDDVFELGGAVYVSIEGCAKSVGAEAADVLKAVQKAGLKPLDPNLAQGKSGPLYRVQDVIDVLAKRQLGAYIYNRLKRAFGHITDLFSDERS